jgi:hypothetical protein
MSYTVTDTAQTQTLTGRGQPKPVYRVWITTGKGATGSIDVDPEDWDHVALPTILRDLARELDLAFTVADDQAKTSHV